MRSLHYLVGSRIGRRLAILLASCCLLPLLVAAALGQRGIAAESREMSQALRAARGLALADALSARIAVADSLAAALLSGERGQGSAQLKAATATSGVFARALIDAEDLASVPLTSLIGSDGAALGLAAERSALTTLSAGADNTSVYLVRRTTLDGRDAVVYFELAPRWLWPQIDSLDTGTVVVDVHGTVLRRSMSSNEQSARAVAAQVATHDWSGAGTKSLTWQAGRSEWQAAAQPVRSPRATRVDQPWIVAVFEPVPAAWPASTALGRGALLAAVLAAVLLLLALAWAGSRYGPALHRMQIALSRLGRGEYAALERESVPRELTTVVDAINDAGERLDEELRVVETFREIDRLLLGATELEPVLDAILSRVNAVTRCESVGIALLDTDSPTHGRVHVASRAPLDLPVTRVEFDPDMIASLIAAEEGITVARCEELRHSFLMPMRELGSEFFWVWPVTTAGRLAAVLAVGFREAPLPDPRLARRGSDFAERLAMALSKTARDEHLYRQAHFDPLTALPNRLLFRDRLAQELASATDGRSRGALLYIDLDHFKRVNDSVGHAAGDQLLQIVAQRLRACVKEGDTVARLAGDEFTVILRNVAEPESASVVAERIIDSLKLPVNLGGRDHFVQASIGITLFPDDGNTIEELLRNADGAMYRAKDLGRSRAVFFDRKLMMSRFDTTHSGLYRALRRREFSLFYQPQYSLIDGSLVGLEALLRWQTPRDGTRQPKDFIPAAETSGLIVDIGGWVLEAACAQYAVWREQGIAPRRLSVNVSVQQLKHAEFPRTVRRVLEKYGIPPAVIEIELTESVFADEVAGAAMRQLSELGLRLALDDFGTGYSSLNYLRQYPIHVVKIDRSFLEDVPINASSATLAATIITMAHALGKEVVAEGVENVEQLDFLRERGCDLAQGFYLARPLPVAQVNDLLQSRHAPKHAESLRQAG